MIDVDDALAEIVRRAGEVEARSAELVAAATDQPAPRRGSPVSLQPASANRKLAPQREVLLDNGRTRFEPVGPYVSSTYVSIAATCPDSCAFKGAGCFASAGASHLTMRRLNEAAKGWPALEVTLAEARAIDKAFSRGVPQDGMLGGRDLRLHVGGEVSCRQGARALGEAARRWLERGGGQIWTYSHRWREIPRAAWGPISVLASCETGEDLDVAAAAGYAPAITVPEFPARTRFTVPGSDRTVIACPAELGSTTCSSCRLCLDRAVLERGEAIGFAAHGKDAHKAKQRLAQIRRRAA